MRGNDMPKGAWKKQAGVKEKRYQQFKELCNNNPGVSRPKLYAEIAKSFGWYSKNQLYEDDFQGRYRRETHNIIY